MVPAIASRFFLRDFRPKRGTLGNAQPSTVSETLLPKRFEPFYLRRVNGNDDIISRHNKLLLLRTRAIDDWEIATLIQLSHDPDPGVRDWATFGIAARDEDTEAVRRALLERAMDPDFDTRSESLWGLARRRDARGLPFLVEALQADEIGTLLIEAAAYYGRSELVESLESLGEWDDDPGLLAEALARCRGDQVERGRTWDHVCANDRD